MLLYATYMYIFVSMVVVVVLAELNNMACQILLRCYYVTACPNRLKL